ncbi:hypothetical protein [Acinetobacter sp. P8-3-8]|uniref:hypothetical protein n=1 Tax=Acinetobacter sp. P8-3-8 TaxID=1029823 RepID=UPI0002485D44|nr:hypothetical protein [Acinetobacter sp. P8-3-8]
MNNQQKIKTEIEQLTLIIHQGINQQSTKFDLNTVFNKVSGDLPLGADAPTFSSRKRMITFQALSKFIQFSVLSLITLIFASSLFFIVFAGKVKITFIFIGLICLVFSLFFLKHALNRLKVYFALKNVQQIIANPEKSLPLVDEFSIAQQFSKERMITRLIGCLITTLSGAILWHIINTSPQPVVQITFVSPFMFMLGIGIILTPISKAESLHRYGTTRLPWKLFPPTLKLCIIIGVLMTILLIGWHEGLFPLTQ